jgi:molecular chaperone GrpE
MSEMSDKPEATATEQPATAAETVGDAAATEAVVEAKPEPARTSEPGPAKPEPPAPDPLVVAQEDLKKTRDQLLRTAADFDNFRKRARRDVDDAQRRGSEEMLKALLPVFDNLERAAQHADQSPEAKAIAEGVRMVLKQLGDTLARMNIKRVPGVGTPFDPLVHEAIQQLESAEHPAGTIIAEIAPGYALGDKLIRAAMVVVAKPPAS